MMTPRFRIPILDRLTSHVRSMRPGDKLIAGVLAVLIVIAAGASLLSLSRSVMVKVPARGGSLHEGVVGTPRFVNPLLALSATDRDLASLTYAGLMGRAGDGSLVPVLAESYHVSEDGTEYLFVLRRGLTFSDGSPLTADDVVFTVEKAQDAALKSPEYANWANVRAEAVDARTVRFTLPKAYAPFLEDTTLGILPERLWKNVSDAEFPFSPRMETPVGAGPFKVAKITRDKDGAAVSYELKAFAGFATGRPYLDSIRFTFFETPADLASALRAHKIESAYGIPAEGALTSAYARVFGVFFNEKENPAFASLAVRKALSIAIDRSRIVDGLLGGYATPLMGPVPPGSGVASPALPPADTRIEDAKRVLTDAGWSYDAEGAAWIPPKSAKDAAKLSSITIRTSTAAELKAEAALIQSDWQQLGIPVSVELYEPGELTSAVIRPRAYEALFFGEIAGRGQDLYAFWSSSERTDPGLNIAGYSDKAVDALLAKARVEGDAAARRALLQELEDAIAADYPAAFTHAPSFLYAVPNGVEGIRLPQITSPSDRFATVANWSRESRYVWPFLVSGK